MTDVPKPASSGEGFAAFISYAHADEGLGAWLHKRLESYSMPLLLIGRPSPLGVVTKRLGKVFRDRADLSAANDLSAEIRSALERANALIVLCSPRSNQSRYVNEEIRFFKQLGKGHRIFAAIVDGEPHAAAKAGHTEADECFPPALLFRVDEQGSVSSEPEAHEPIAADFRPGRDGRTNASLKLIAGLHGLALDELIQRDRAQRVRRAAIDGAGVLVVLAVVVALGLSVRQSTNQLYATRADLEAKAREATERRDELRASQQNELDAQLAMLAGRIDDYDATDAVLASLLGLKLRPPFSGSGQAPPHQRWPGALANAVFAGRTLISSIPCPNGCYSAVLVPDGRSLLLVRDSTVQLIEIDGALRFSWPMRRVQALAISDDGRHAAAYGEGLHLLDTSNGGSIKLSDAWGASDVHLSFVRDRLFFQYVADQQPRLQADQQPQLHTEIWNVSTAARRWERIASGYDPARIRCMGSSPCYRPLGGTLSVELRPGRPPYWTAIFNQADGTRVPLPVRPATTPAFEISPDQDSLIYRVSDSGDFVVVGMDGSVRRRFTVSDDSLEDDAVLASANDRIALREGNQLRIVGDTATGVSTGRLLSASRDFDTFVLGASADVGYGIGRLDIVRPDQEFLCARAFEGATATTIHPFAGGFAYTSGSRLHAINPETCSRRTAQVTLQASDAWSVLPNGEYVAVLSGARLSLLRFSDGRRIAETGVDRIASEQWPGRVVAVSNEQLCIVAGHTSCYPFSIPALRRLDEDDDRRFEAQVWSALESGEGSTSWESAHGGAYEFNVDPVANARASLDQQYLMIAPRGQPPRIVNVAHLSADLDRLHASACEKVRGLDLTVGALVRRFLPEHAWNGLETSQERVC